MLTNIYYFYLHSISLPSEKSISLPILSHDYYGAAISVPCYYDHRTEHATQPVTSEYTSTARNLAYNG